MKIHGKGGLLDFSKDKLTERNKENSFLDVDWIIEELINYGHEKMTNSVPKSPNNTLQRSASIKSKFKKKVRFLFFEQIMNGKRILRSDTTYPFDIESF